MPTTIILIVNTHSKSMKTAIIIAISLLVIAGIVATLAYVNYRCSSDVVDDSLSDQPVVEPEVVDEPENISFSDVIDNRDGSDVPPPQIPEAK